MKIRNFFWLMSFALLLFSCKEKSSPKPPAEEILPDEDLMAKHKFQGIWIDAESEDVLFRAVGDTIYYPDSTSVPVYFCIKDKKIYFGSKENAYTIDKQMNNVFWFHSQTGDVVKLHKSEEPTDSLAFVRQPVKVLTFNEVVKKDTVLNMNGKRYHAYIYVNPTRHKVYKTTYTDEGIGVQNVYYDNIIHIAVYDGKTCLYSKDFSKKDFTGMIPDDFLKQALLSNMEFTGINAEGTHFKATVCIPDGASCYCVGIVVSFDGEMSKELEEY